MHDVIIYSWKTWKYWFYNMFLMILDENQRVDFSGWLVLLIPQLVFDDFSFWTLWWCMYEKHENVDFTKYILMILDETCTCLEFGGWLVLLILQQVFDDFSFWTLWWRIYEKHENVDFTMCFKCFWMKHVPV